jgi:hypothetical protein
MASLQQYVEQCGKWLDASTLIISDANGVEIASWGPALSDFQLACAIFQSSSENLSKLSVGKGRTLLLRFNSHFLLQHSILGLYLTLLLPLDASIGKVFSNIERIEKDLRPLISLITEAKDS